MDPVTAIDWPEPGSFYVIEITFSDKTTLRTVARYRGEENGMMLWETPPAAHGVTVAAVSILSKIETREP